MKKLTAVCLVMAALMAFTCLAAACNPAGNVKGLELGEMPSKTVYVEGETFDPAGMVVYKVMSDGNYVEATDYKVDTTTPLTLADTSVLVYVGENDEFYLEVPITVRPAGAAIENHMILNSDGSYGGTLNKSKYGEGAPLNGQYDVPDSPYYAVNDYYNLASTQTRTMVSHFAPYQKTMKDTSGLACMLMILNHDGADVASTYSETVLLADYEQLNTTTVYGNGTTPQGLKKLFDNYGYTTEINTYNDPGSGARKNRCMQFINWLDATMLQGKLIMVRFRDGEDFGWHVILGHDDMGTINNERDDQMIFADPNDNLDHCQDGYQEMALVRFWRWWEDIQVVGGKFDAVNRAECVVVTPKNAISYTTGAETMPGQKLPARHLILNNHANSSLASGTFGGTEDTSKYGEGTPRNGEFDTADKNNYIKAVDVYSLTDTASLQICEQFITKQQTMASSCALVSIMATFNFYGEDIVNKYTEIQLVKDYEKLFNMTVNGSGTSSSGRARLVREVYGYTAVSDSHSQTNSFAFDTYGEFKTWVVDLFKENTPCPICWTPYGNHGVVLIGLDDMGTDYIYDDVLFIADSGDSWDTYTDGYNVVPATLFYRHWFGNADPGVKIQSQQYNVIYRKG